MHEGFFCAVARTVLYCRYCTVPYCTAGEGTRCLVYFSLKMSKKKGAAYKYCKYCKEDTEHRPS